MKTSRRRDRLQDARLPDKSKTRLSPPLRPEECAAISGCFIRDLSAHHSALAEDGDVAGCAVYTPVGSEAALRQLLPADFHLILQGEGDLGARLLKGTQDLLEAGYAGAILVNSDSPTLPQADPARGGRCACGRATTSCSARPSMAAIR